MGKRKQRDKLKVTDEELLQPLDITKFGSDKDPCFGKLYKLTEKECKRCGDSEICGIVYAQKATKDRTKLEKESRFKDIEMDNDLSVVLPAKIAQLQDRGFKRYKIVAYCKKEFKVDRKTILKYL